VGETAKDDQLYRLTYDGSVAEEHGFVVMGGTSEPLATFLRERHDPTAPLQEVLQLGVDALAHTGPDGSARVIAGDDLEAAVLDRTRPVAPSRGWSVGGSSGCSHRPSPPREAPCSGRLAAVLLLVPACSSGDDDSLAASATECPEQTLGEGSTDLASKPVLVDSCGPAPDELVVTDIVEGEGDVAEVGDPVTMQYVGVLHEDGTEFDASWDRGEPFEFTLGTGQVIAGWDEGIVGMREGGRRQLVIPPDLGYGDQGAGGAIPAAPPWCSWSTWSRSPAPDGSDRRAAIDGQRSTASGRRQDRRPAVDGTGRRAPSAAPSQQHPSAAPVSGSARLPSTAAGHLGKMPKTDRKGNPVPDELPGTLQRSPEKAQRTFAKTYDSAAETYGPGERAARTAMSAVKHSFEKVGDHWEPKDEPGPSDAQAARDTADGSARDRPTAGGVDANASKRHLYELAQRLEVPGRSSMTKAQLVEAIGKANDRATARARR
jgi:hypothetical protein